jgi:hypothetical protein
LIIPVLAKLTSQDFEEAVGSLVPASVLRRVLHGNVSVRAVSEAFQIGTATEQNLRDFIRAELGALRRGEPLPHDLALAALAVALEGSRSSFATEFITGLAGLDIVELQMSVLMARECLKHRRSVPLNEARSFLISAPDPSRDPVAKEVVDHGEKRTPPRTFIASETHASP